MRLAVLILANLFEARRGQLGAALPGLRSGCNRNPVKRASLLLFFFLSGCGGTAYISNLPLEWRGVSGNPKPTQPVEDALAKIPVRLAPFADIRTDKKAVGWYEDDGYVVRTIDDVPTYVTSHVREMLGTAGAKLDDRAPTTIAGTIMEFGCTEGGLFNGHVRMRVAVTRPDGSPWEKVYEGRSKRWGRSHNIENYNEALSNALSDATRSMIQDAAFATALTGDPAK
jgi:hypothetical protein